MANPESIPSEDFNDGLFESSCLTIFKKATFQYTWSIYDFSDYCVTKGTILESSIFSDGTLDGLKWRLNINSNGWHLHSDDKYYLALHVFLVSNINVTLETCCKLSILNDKSEQIQFCERKTQFSISKLSESFHTFIEKDKLFDYKTKNKILFDNKLTILCEIVVLGNSKNISGQLRMPNDLGLKLFENPDFSVVTFSVAGKELQALKTILVANSSVFQVMFKYDTKEIQINRIEIVDVEYETFKEMLRFMYTNTIPNLKNMAHRLFVAADKYALENLKYRCEEWMSKNLSVTNAAEYYVLANQHNGEMLKIRAKMFIMANGPAVTLTVGFRIGFKEHPQLFKNLGLPKNKNK